MRSAVPYFLLHSTTAFSSACFTAINVNEEITVHTVAHLPNPARRSPRARHIRTRTHTALLYIKTGLEKLMDHKLCPPTPLSALALAFLTTLREERHLFPRGTSPSALFSPSAHSSCGETWLRPASLLALRDAGHQEDPYAASREANDCSMASTALQLFLGEN